MAPEASPAKVPTRRDRIRGYVLALVICVGYVAAFAFAHHALASGDSFRAWGSFVICVGGLIVIPLRLRRELRDPEGAEAEARARAEERAARKARPYAAGLKFLIAGFVLVAIGAVLMVVGVNAGVAAVAGGFFIVVGYANPREWRKRWPQDFPILARIVGRWEGGT